MGKRSDFPRIDRDFYPTPPEAVAPLLPHLSPGTEFAEPCAGDGALVRELEANGHLCAYAADIAPQDRWIVTANALEWRGYARADVVITNPPWARPTLHALIERFWIQPTWLLFDADWMHTKQAAPYMRGLKKIVSVGRVKWIPDSKMTGKDNCAWYLFDTKHVGQTRFFGRTDG